MTRRDLLKLAGCATITRLEFPLSLLNPPVEPLRLAVITDIHHGLAPDSMVRLDSFIAAVNKREKLDAILQLGDFCHAVPESNDFIKKFKALKPQKIQVLGNHDMDKVDKDTAMKYWDMPSRYGTVEIGDFIFLWLDLNHFKKNNELVAYDKSNYFTDNATHNWADEEQIQWLEETLLKARKPVLLLSHQPLGFAEKDKPLPPEQTIIVDIVRKAKKLNPKGAVCLSLFGHLHVDRLEKVDDIPFYCINSASYFWSSGMWPYSKPLFAFMEITSDGKLIIEGVQGDFTKAPPKVSDTVIGRSASIGNRTFQITK